MIEQNNKAMAHLKALINEGKFDNDPNGDMVSFSKSEVDSMSGPSGKGWLALLDYHLGTSEGSDPESMAYYKYPAGKDGMVHRSNLVDAREKAESAGDDDVVEDIDELLGMMDSFQAKADTDNADDSEDVPPYVSDEERESMGHEKNEGHEGEDEEEGTIHNIGLRKGEEQANYSLKNAAMSRVITPEGYMEFTADIMKAGILEYTRHELFGTYNEDSSKDLTSLCVYTPASVLFASKVLNTFRLKPICMGHPFFDIDSTNHRYQNVGTTGSDVRRTANDRVRIDGVITDRRTVLDVQDHNQEVSMGASSALKMKAGKHKGEPYDARVVKLRMNHLALVQRGRAGEDIKLLNEEGTEVSLKKKDGATDEPKEADADIKNSVSEISTKVDDLTKTVATLAQTVLAITAPAKPQDASLENAAQVPDEDGDRPAVVANSLSNTEAVGQLQGENAALKQRLQEVTQHNSEKAVQDRAVVLMGLYNRANHVAPADYTQFTSPIEVMSAAIRNKYPDMELKGKSDVFIETYFENLAMETKAAYSSIKQETDNILEHDKSLQERNAIALSKRLEGNGPQKAGGII